MTLTRRCLFDQARRHFPEVMLVNLKTFRECEYPERFSVTTIWLAGLVAIWRLTPVKGVAGLCRGQNVTSASKGIVNGAS
jgi:hypothetical protein